MIVLRIRRTATTPLLSSPFTSSQPIHPPPPSLTLPVAKISLGFNGAGSLTFTRRRTNHQPRTANSYMAGVGSSVVNPTYAEIIVVRHGETDWNADGRIQGHLDVELNDTGRQQAATVADRLSREPSISVVYSSDLKRALETAQIIAAGCGAQEVIKEPDLWERHLGDLQGLVLREAAKLSPKAYQAFLNQRTDQEIPGGGESLDQLYERCTSSLERIGKKHRGERVIVVTHGGVIRTLYKRACPNGRSRGKSVLYHFAVAYISSMALTKIETTISKQH
ncbi:phosphoglycerate mutase-like protein 4 isoform X3 [Carya illinoinensis]|uniref:phosphoglycerate mutase-like protein 4 isoform X3 n=1 Tax=Carya illinoinensis TaxID=32201 RepID=UPI001C717C79|nr:phosphoglycerate mutase-like protein 4 isoform X3 [Carya illinoinensis]